MWEELEQRIRDLSDLKAGWVTRRDAAEALGAAASKALTCLNTYRDDKDQDIRSAVQRALATVPRLAASAPNDAGASTVEELVKSCEKPNKRMVTPHGEGFTVQVKLEDERSQVVYVKPFARSDGLQLIRVYTFCGEANDETIRWSMAANTKLPHCAFALHKSDNKEWIILAYNFDRERAKPADFKTVVQAIAYYGDWFEQRRGGADEF